MTSPTTLSEVERAEQIETLLIALAEQVRISTKPIVGDPHNSWVNDWDAIYKAIAITEQLAEVGDLDERSSFISDMLQACIPPTVGYEGEFDIADIELFLQYDGKGICKALGAAGAHRREAEKLVELFMSGSDSERDEDSIYRNGVHEGNAGVGLYMRVGLMLEDLLAIDPNFNLFSVGLTAQALKTNGGRLDFEGTVGEVRSTIERLLSVA